MKVPAMKAAHIIDPRCVYDLAIATTILGLKPSCLKLEARIGRLRVARRGGKYYILGSWLLQWLKAGEAARSQPEANGHTNGHANGEAHR